MAEEETTVTAETEETAETTEEETAETTEETTETEESSEVLQIVYVGPTIPASSLRQGQIIRGTKESIDRYLAKLYERFPEIKYLLVTPEALPQAQRKVQTKGNILHKYYQDTAAKALSFRRGN